MSRPTTQEEEAMYDVLDAVSIKYAYDRSKGDTPRIQDNPWELEKYRAEVGSYAWTEKQKRSVLSDWNVMAVVTSREPGIGHFGDTVTIDLQFSPNRIDKVLAVGVVE